MSESEHVVHAPVEGINRFGLIHISAFAADGTLVHAASVAPSPEPYVWAVPPGIFVATVVIDRL